jgi:hypothetical protein
MSTPAEKSKNPGEKITALEDKTNALDEKFTAVESKQDEILAALKAMNEKQDAKAEAAPPKAEEKEEPAAADSEAPQFNTQAVIDGVYEKFKAEGAVPAPKAEKKPDTEPKAESDSETPDALASLTEKITSMSAELKALKEASATKTPGGADSAVESEASSGSDAGGESEAPSYLEVVAADKEINPAGATAEELESDAKGTGYTMNVLSKALAKLGPEDQFNPEAYAEQQLKSA